MPIDAPGVSERGSVRGMATGSFEPLEPPQRLGNMKLLARLGEGGMASVFLAAVGEGPLARLCAVKRVRVDKADSEYRGRFVDEAQVVVRLHHNNLVDVREAGEVGGQLFIAMELVQGRDLADVWDQCFELQRQLPVELAVFIVREALRGLHYAHTHSGLSLVHRDVSPSNILVDWAGAVRVADFGLATSTLKVTTTSPGLLFGKLAYMSPEQARSQELDGRADTYSCAVVLWELVTGRPLRNLELNAARVANYEAELASQTSQRIDPHLDSIIARALKNDRDHRYPDAHQFMMALNEWLVANAPQTTQETLAAFLGDLFPGHADNDRKQYDDLLRRARRPITQRLRRAGKGVQAVDGGEQEELSEGTVIAERYRVERGVGKGGMGTVYLAEHTTVGRKVAIKVLTSLASANPKDARRFREEARAASAVGHPNIVEVFDAGTLTDGRLYLVMEYLTGGSLSDELDENGRFSVERAVQAVREITRAVVAAHAVGIIHRDLKPDNVMIEPRVDGEQFKVLDFGISASMERFDDRRLTRPGVLIGTPEYMPPEQARGGEPSPSFDIYAIGVIFYELLAGHPPMSSDNLSELLRRKTTEESPPIELIRPDVPPELGALIRSCLHIEPAMRPETAGDVLEVLDAWKEKSVRLTPGGRSITRSVIARRRRRVGVTAAMGTLALVAVVGVFFRGRVLDARAELVALPRGIRPQVKPGHDRVALRFPALPEPMLGPMVLAKVAPPPSSSSPTVRSTPRKARPKGPSAEACQEILSRVEKHRKARQHPSVASLLRNNMSCWRGNADYLATLAEAYFQTQRYSECVKLQQQPGAHRAEVKKMIARCIAKSSG